MTIVVLVVKVVVELEMKTLYVLQWRDDLFICEEGESIEKTADEPVEDNGPANKFKRVAYGRQKVLAGHKPVEHQRSDSTPGKWVTGFFFNSDI
jgi:hypothetical protein